MNNISNQIQAVVSQADLFMLASINKDALFMKEFLLPEFLFITPRGTLFDHQSFFRDFIANNRFAIEIFKMLEQQVMILNGVAVLNGITAVKFVDQNEQYERITMVFVQRGNRWLLLNIHGTFTSKPE